MNDTWVTNCPLEEAARIINQLGGPRVAYVAEPKPSKTMTPEEISMQGYVGIWRAKSKEDSKSG